MRGCILATLVGVAIVGPGAAAQPGIAYLAVDLKTKTPIATERSTILDTPILPGSVMKIATIAAALESGIISEKTAVACDREVTIAGHRLTCAHPDLHRPLTPVEALAHSCDVYAASVAARLSRSAFDRALTSLGLPPSDPRRPIAASTLGIDGIRVTPRRLVEMMVRIAAEPSPLAWKPATLAVIRQGLRGAAQYGTASALAARGVDALAKTGTTLTATGLEQGLVVGVTPSGNPSVGFVLVTSGAAGMDAAALAAERLAPQAPRASPATTLRIGIARDGGGYAVRTIPLEEYVAGVLAGEAARDSGPAALEALAITIRTFALANRERHGADGFDLCDLTHCQVFRKSTSVTERAAAVTAGQILLFNGVPASVFYSASCGGHTERPSEVWPGASNPPFLPSRNDAACDGEPAWAADLTAVDLARALRTGGFKGDTLRNLRIISRNESGRVARLRVDGFVPNEISGQDLRTVVGRTLGWQHIKSAAFDLRRGGSGFHFAGHGSGHGVGLCVIGSVRLAARGESAEKILARYFPGLRISAGVAASSEEIRLRPDPTSPTPAATRAVTVLLPEGDEGERDLIQDLAVRERDALARQLGVAVPPRLALRFHPTVESYQRATGQSWFTTAATFGNDMHFVPLTVLRQRGVLERTVRHELVHVLTAPTLAGRPLWVREGAAMYFAGERPARGDEPRAAISRTRFTCPSDRDIQRPVSPGALSTAYAQAAQCFTRQMDSGKKWSEVR